MSVLKEEFLLLKFSTLYRDRDTLPTTNVVVDSFISENIASMAKVFALDPTLMPASFISNLDTVTHGGNAVTVTSTIQ